ncbi:hypothetical protein TTHERM_01123910 (macronuclear) [Tetrahymena thermophila SB210]|uniref:Uncharacterized protein n=1 Tax=Tetrahymena thermophila (strain SB210) TaxID=312017 RepID=Q22B47_TETTS|nr:hypothetical protein TTHERM_01123910 [Tetrahymena thermophila SB210]EAR82508.1 hypothetical protein TTHERM_01123910 [Tetrahymena thermophila SB210]|eukprot:XP_001030171.1 hypothetical protein TTHERM_01123910 [Tetrahymena thermophila SB210]
MDFIKENKGKILVAVAAVGGLLWIQSRNSSIPDQITKLINSYIEKRKNVTEEDMKKEDIIKLRKEISYILKQFVQKGKNKEEREGQYIEFYITFFQIFYKQIKELSDDQQQMKGLIEGYRDIMGSFLQISLLGDSLFESNQDNKFSVQECFYQLFTNGEIEEKIDTIDFIFSSLHFIREEDLVNFVDSRIMVNQDLKFNFLTKLIRHSHTCLKIISNPENRLSNSDFYFSKFYFEMIGDIKFLKQLQPLNLIQSMTLFNAYCSNFNKNLELFILKETFMLKWQKLIQSILSNQEYIKQLSNEQDSAKTLSEIFKQLAFSLFNFTISFNIEEKQLDTYTETFQQRILPFSSVLLLAEETLKTMDCFLKNLKKLGLINKHKNTFMTIIHDFLLTLVQFYDKNNCSNYINIFILSISLMIINCHNQIPSSKTINQFWASIYLPKDCSLQIVSETFFRMSLVQFFEMTGLTTFIESLIKYYEPDMQKKIKVLLQLLNNKRYNFNRLRIIGYQFAILQSDFEDQVVQENITNQIFKKTNKDNKACIFSLINIGEKIFTPLHYINQIDVETDISDNEEKQEISQQIEKYTQECIQYLINVFQLSKEKISIEDMLTYARNGIHSKLTLEQIKSVAEEDDQNNTQIKQGIVLNNQMELFFDKQMVFQGFELTQLNQDMSLIFYDTLDFVKEIQYRLFTKKFFVDYAVTCFFKNPLIITQIHTHALVLYELMIDFIYEYLIKNPEHDNQDIDYLKDQLCDDNTVFSTLKKDSLLFIEGNQTAKSITEQLLKRVEARLEQISKL